ncbi:MAG: putative nicotinate-nucleotide adenylyltransferase [Parcubacteria group bacterium GW2011_GWA2_47_10]|nr:MAG: putative nicotinate-nucleotide adenylyltransferase [Parcubacteria group bacterium GW2011_GWA2_47_10]
MLTITQIWRRLLLKDTDKILNNLKGMKIGVLGSACNPPHKAHIRAGELVRKKLGLNRILLIPTSLPPHKEKPAVLPAVRLEMARLAVKGLPHWKVSTMELKRPGKSYTKDTIRELKKKYPKDDFFYIMGSDNLLTMPKKWFGGYESLDLCQFVVLERPGYPLSEVPQAIRQKVIGIQQYGAFVISSTMIRKAIKEKNVEKIAKFLSPNIRQFIKKMHLYEK